MKMRFILLSLAAAAAAMAQTQPQLKVLSSTVNLGSPHLVNIELENQGDKTVTAYDLEIKQLDASGKTLSDDRIGWNNIYFNPTGAPDQREAGLIRPGKTLVQYAGAMADTVSAQVAVLAVVYDDRTWEGDQSAVFPLFDIRARTAEKLKQAAAIMQTYPASRDAARATIQNLRDLDCAPVWGALVNTVGVPVAPDKAQPLPETVGLPDKAKWNSAAHALSEEAAFWAAQSQKEAHQ